MTEERIIDKIKKMLALAADLAASEGERDNALRMAYNLMAKHNIEMARVEAHGEEQQEPRIDFGTYSFSWMWAKQIHSIIGQLFFCELYCGHRKNATQVEYHFVGRESNVATAAVMADYIVKSILKEGRALYKQNTAPGTVAFAKGAMHKLHSRVLEIRKSTEKAAEPGTALVLLSHYEAEKKANEALMPDDLVYRKSAERGISADNRDAYRKGVEFGGKINLNLQVSEDQKARLK